MTQVFAAKYSNVPVWVANVNNVNVMRRQGDGWVNATHLLKVADFDKPRRTRILERDVQTGEHEKVQGGYGKYQGTWIPVERAYVLSRQVNILDLVESLLSYSPQDGVAIAELPKQSKPAAARKQPSGTTLSGQKIKRARKMSSMPSQPLHPPGSAGSPVPTAPHPGPHPGQVGQMGHTAPHGSAPHHLQAPPSIGMAQRAQAMQSMPPLTTNYQNMSWPQFSPQSSYTSVMAPSAQPGGAPGLAPPAHLAGQNTPQMQLGQVQLMPPAFPMQSPYYVSDMSPGSTSMTSGMQSQGGMSYPPAAGGSGNVMHTKTSATNTSMSTHGQGSGSQSFGQTLGSAFPRQGSNGASGRPATTSPSMSSSVLSSNDDGFSDTEMDRSFANASSTAGNTGINPSGSGAGTLSGPLSGASASGAGEDLAPGAASGLAASGADSFGSAYNAQTAARANAWTQGPSHYMADYSSKLLNFFMSPDKTVIPASLLQPEPGMDLDHPIDDEGNTAFHWTCAIGRVELMRALLRAGVNKHALNKSGQNALSFLVMFTNNYETRSFPKVLELLSDQVAFVDPKGRTVLHHIANTATSSARSATARYYAEILLAKVSSYSPKSDATEKQADIGDAAALRNPANNGNGAKVSSGPENGSDNAYGSSGAAADNQNPENQMDNKDTPKLTEAQAADSLSNPQLTPSQTIVEPNDTSNGSRDSKDADKPAESNEATHSNGELNVSSNESGVPEADMPLIKPGGFAEWLDHQDNKGDTALHIASRWDSRRLVKVLLSYKASPLLPNKLGQTPDDLYTQAKKKREADQFSGQGQRRPHHHRHSSSSQTGGVLLSEAAQASQQVASDIAAQLQEIAEIYDQDVVNKESDIAQVQELVAKIQQDIVDAEMALPALRSEIGAPEEVEVASAKIENDVQEKLTQLRQLIERSQARDLAVMVQREESQAQEAENQLTDDYKLDRQRQLKLGTELAELQKNRKLLVAEIGALYSEAGSATKISKYRKLLAVCCEVPEDQVDGLLDGINQALDTSGP